MLCFHFAKKEEAGAIKLFKGVLGCRAGKWIPSLGTPCPVAKDKLLHTLFFQVLSIWECGSSLELYAKFGVNYRDLNNLKVKYVCTWLESSDFSSLLPSNIDTFYGTSSHTWLFIIDLTGLEHPCLPECKR